MAIISRDVEKEIRIKKLTDKLMAQCSRREYCVADVRAKAMKALEGDEQAAQKVVDALVADRFVSDLRYASAYARDKSRIAGWGRVKISASLRAKGIDQQTISAALEEIDPDQARQRAEKAMEVKYRSLRDDPQWRMKMLRFALGRGFTYDEASELISSLKVKNQN